MNNENICQEMSGWKIIRTADVSIPKSKLLELEHIKTGARYIHLASESKENVFAIVLKTVPEDSTGVAHILEHTVLTGSRKYPVRDPFFSMIKRSLQTFMNAFTSNDWTGYPFASPNRKDFYNIMSVYLDAVFFPNISKLNFMQEGWRYSFTEGRLKYEGVVYNEMKGSMSSVDRHMEEALNKSLYTVAPYCHNTGGDPVAIPGLTHEMLKEFHAKYYHPSNALFYSFGNLPLEENLKMVNENVMDHFVAGYHAEIVPEKRWNEPKAKSYHYPVLPNDVEDKHQAALAWLMCPSTDNLEVFSLELLDDILLGSTAAPLRKALLDSGLGSDLCDSIGYDSEFFDTKFVVGLKDVNEKNIAKVNDLIISTLKELAEEGIDSELVNSVISSNETRKRNETNHPYPIGLQTMLDILPPFFHGGDVSETLDFEKLLGEIKENIAKGRYFEELIKKYFLENKHRVLLTLVPDGEMLGRLEANESAKLNMIEEGMNEDEKKEILENAQKLIALQSENGDLSCLPTLELTDIEKEIEITGEEASSTEKLKIYKKNTNGLIHLVGESSLDALDEESIRYAPFFSSLITKLGTGKRNYEELAKLIDLISGGVSISPQVFKIFGKEKNETSAMFAYTYCLRNNFSAVLELLKEIIKDTDLGDIKRIRMLLKVLYSECQASIVDNGHSYAMMKAASPLSGVNMRNELWNGLEQISFLGKIRKAEGDEADEALLSKLKNIATHLGDNLFRNIAVIGENDVLDERKKIIDEFLCTGEERGAATQPKDKLRVAFGTATAVSFVAAAAKVPDIFHADSPSLLVLSKILSRGFLHNEIREKRGAYGGFVRYDRVHGNLCFGSYRDPHIVSTLKTFGEAKKSIYASGLTEKEVEEAIISVSADIDRPVTEAEQARKAFTRHLTGLTDEARRTFKERLLLVKKADLERVSEKYLHDNWHDYSVAVISSKEKIEAANERLGEYSLDVENLA